MLFVCRGELLWPRLIWHYFCYWNKAILWDDFLWNYMLKFYVLWAQIYVMINGLKIGPKKNYVTGHFYKWAVVRSPTTSQRPSSKMGPITSGPGTLKNATSDATLAVHVRCHVGRQVRCHINIHVNISDVYFCHRYWAWVGLSGLLIILWWFRNVIDYANLWRLRKKRHSI